MRRSRKPFRGITPPTRVRIPPPPLRHRAPATLGSSPRVAIRGLLGHHLRRTCLSGSQGPRVARTADMESRLSARARWFLALALGWRGVVGWVGGGPAAVRDARSG